MSASASARSRAAAATASCSCSRSTSPGRPVRRCSSTRTSSSVAVGGVERRRRRRRTASARAACGPPEGMHVAEPAPALLEVGLEQERHLAGALVAVLDATAPARRATASTACATAASAASASSAVSSRVAGDVPGRQQRRRRVEVVGGEGERLLRGAHGVAELQPLVPDRVPDPLGELRRCRRRPLWRSTTSMSDCGASSARPYPPTATRATPSDRRAAGRSGEELAQPVVDQRRCTRGTRRSPTRSVSSSSAWRASFMDEGWRRAPRWHRRRARRCGCARRRSTSVTQILPSPILPGPGGRRR